MYSASYYFFIFALLLSIPTRDFAFGANEVESALQVNRIVLETANELDRLSDSNGEVSEDILKSLVKTATVKAVEEYANTKLDPKQGTFLSEQLNRVQWSSVVASLKQMKNHTVGLLRSQGIPIAATVVVGAVLEVTLPIALTYIRHPELIPLAVMFPFEPIVYEATRNMEKAYLKGKLAKLYGGRENYETVHRLYAETRKQMKMGEGDLLLPISGEHGTESFVISNENELQRIARLLRLTPERLTLATLTKFLRKNAIHDEVIEGIKKNKELSQVEKAALILNHLEDKHAWETFSDLKKHFSENVAQVDSNTPNEELVKWTLQALKAKSFKEAHTVLGEIPSGIPTRTVARVWKEILLPHFLGKAEHLSIKESAALRWEGERMVAQAEQAPKEHWNQRWLQHVRSSVEKSLNGNHCLEAFALIH